MLPQIFYMQRETGIVAYGVKFNCGKCVVIWIGEHSSIVVWDSIEFLKAVCSSCLTTEFVFI